MTTYPFSGLKVLDVPDTDKATLAWKLGTIPQNNIEYKITVKCNNLIAEHQDVIIKGREAQPDSNGFVKAVVPGLSPDNKSVFPL